MNDELETIGDLVQLIEALRTQQVLCEHNIIGQCDECDYAHCEPINPFGILSTYREFHAEV